MKSNKLRKILSITIISLVLALTVAVIVLAIVPKKHYDPVNRDFNMISVYRETSSGAFAVKKGTQGTDESQDTVDKLMELYEKSLKASVLSSMFQGTGKFEPNVVAKDTSMSGKYNVSSVLALVFTYNSTQTLCLNGKEYKYTSLNQTKTVTYDRAVLVLTDTESFEKVTLYLIEGDESVTTSKFQVEFLAHQSELYDYITEMDGLIAQA